MLLKKIFLLITLISTSVFSDSVKLIDASKTFNDKNSTWSFSASVRAGAGFYFWKDEHNNYIFKYQNINKLLTSTITSKCCAGLKGKMKREEVDKLQEIIAKIKKLKTSDIQITTMIHSYYLRTFTEKNGKDMKKYHIDFLDSNKTNLLIEFYTFFNTFKGKIASPCPSWGSKISIRNSRDKDFQCKQDDIAPFI
jgi:hypothetical protein